MAAMIDPLEPVFLVEGEIDALTLIQAGFRAVSLPNATTKLTPAMRDTLLQAAYIVLAGDSDGPGTQCMEKLWAEFGDRSYLLRWPSGLKDANAVYLNIPAGPDRVRKMNELVTDLVNQARANPMPGVYSLAESMAASKHTSLSDNPQRFRWTWPDVDKMAVILPGSVTTIFATNALVHGTRVMTPSGMTTVESLKNGDFVMGRNGKPTQILAVLPKGKRTVFELTFSDGTSSRCDAEHLWFVRDRNLTVKGSPHHKNPSVVLQTQEMAATKLKHGRSSFRYSIPLPSPVEFESKDLPIPAYTFGALLGDGSFRKFIRMAQGDSKSQIISRMKEELGPGTLLVQYPNNPTSWYVRSAKKYSPNKVLDAVRAMGLYDKSSHTKFIPSLYLFSSVNDREALLQGLMDTDGCAKENGSLSYTTISRTMVEGVAFLVRSLGGHARIRPREKRDRTFTLYFSLPDEIKPFWLPRKTARYVARGGKNKRRKNIVSIERLERQEEMTCVMVAASDGLFLIDDFAVTHNTGQGKTTFIADATVDSAISNHEVVLNYQCELSVEEFSNLVAAYLLVKDRNTLTRDDYVKAAKLLRGAQYYVGRDATLTRVGAVLDLIEAAIKRFGPTVVVLDNLHFICRNESDDVKAQANAMQRIKNMAVKYGLKFFVLGQPRKAKQETKGRLVHITDLKGSGAAADDAETVIAIHRQPIRFKDPNNPPADEYDTKAEIHLLKARFKGVGRAMTSLQFCGNIAAFRQLMREDGQKTLQETP